MINARTIFGKDIWSLKGKTARRKESHVELQLRMIPAEIMEHHREVVVCIDLMHLNGIPFAISISRALKLCTAEALVDQHSTTLLGSLKRVKMTYARRGFIMNQVAAGNESSCLDSQLSNAGISLNVFARDEHVLEVERHRRTLKDRCLLTYNTLPFKKLPARMLVELVYGMTFWIHAIPATDGLSRTISPREVVTGVSLDAGKHSVVPFGGYVHTHEEHDNPMRTGTIGSIAMRST